MNYAEKLKTPRWQKKRLKIFEHDKWRCTKCGTIEKELQVHHLDYIEDIEPWDYPDDMLTTLCSTCHNVELDRPKHEKYLLQSLKMNGFLVSDILKLSTLIDCSKSFVNSLKIVVRKDYE